MIEKNRKKLLLIRWPEKVSEEDLKDEKHSNGNWGVIKKVSYPFTSSLQLPDPEGRKYVAALVKFERQINKQIIF